MDKPNHALTRWHRLSLSSAGARIHFDIGVALISVLPLLALLYVGSQGSGPEAVPWTPRLVLVAIAGLCMLLGYGVLSKYPRTIIRLRRYLDGIARGELPAEVALPRHETDIAAIERGMNRVLDHMKQRVMTETLATACHNLGQPATVISGYIELLRKTEPAPERQKMLDECLAAVSDLDAAIRRLQSVRAYRPVPYLSSAADAAWSHDMLIDAPAPDAKPL